MNVHLIPSFFCYSTLSHQSKTSSYWTACVTTFAVGSSRLTSRSIQLRYSVTVWGVDSAAPWSLVATQDTL